MKNVGQYMYVTHDHTRNDGYRVLVSGALNANGLIGPEYNGLVVLDDVHKAVVADCIGRQSTGWYSAESGPSDKLIRLFEEVKDLPSGEFAKKIEDLAGDRLRSNIEVREDSVLEF